MRFSRWDDAPGRVTKSAASAATVFKAGARVTSAVFWASSDGGGQEDKEGDEKDEQDEDDGREEHFEGFVDLRGRSLRGLAGVGLVS